MDIPRTLGDLKRLIENKVQENVHLDYKASAALAQNFSAVRADLGKDVSAFANSDGGALVIGILEDKQTGLPDTLDQGVPNGTWRRERIEDVISTVIAPQIHGVEIIPIPAGADASYYSIIVPKSYRGHTKSWFRTVTTNEQISRTGPWKITRSVMSSHDGMSHLL